MNTKKKSGNILLPVLFVSAFLFQQCNNAETEHQSHQTNNNFSVPENIQELITSPNKQVLSRQSTIKLSAQSETQTIKAQGYIDFDRNRSKTVSAQVGGRIEKLHVKYELQYVNKGDKVLELYSPELNTFQEEHLFLLKSEKEKYLVEQSREKLKLLGVTENQISQLEKNKTFTQRITLYSPADGYVHFNTTPSINSDADATEKTSMKSMKMTTKNNSDNNFGSSASQIREGMYINKGETLFNVNDLQKVWAIVSISSEYHSALSENNEVKIVSELLPDKKIIGKIALVEQVYEEDKQKFIRVRIALPNPDTKLKLNSLVMAEIQLEPEGNFQIPASAVYHTGLSSVVWVKTGTTQNGTGIFQLRKVSTGSEINGMTSIISGLSGNEEVAEHAGLLTDSETFLNND